MIMWKNFAINQLCNMFFLEGLRIEKATSYGSKYLDNRMPLYFPITNVIVIQSNSHICKIKMHKEHTFLPISPSWYPIREKENFLQSTILESHKGKGRRKGDVATGSQQDVGDC